MKVIIAEKPRMAQSIAAALNVPSSTAKGVYRNSEYCVVSCQGHVITEFEPHDYDEAYKQWRLDCLPILPQKWKVKPIKGKERFISVIHRALQDASVVYGAGDPDAAGQRIVDEVLSYLGWKGKVLRPLISDLNPDPIRKAIENAESNDLAKFKGLYRKEASRARGDWLLGLNLTRLYTLLGDQYGLNTTFSAGRVQSATLGLIVKRDLEILNFQPHDYYAIKARVETHGEDFQATWQPCDEHDGLDDHGRLVSPRVAMDLVKAAPCAGVVESFAARSGKERAPLTYSMSDLQKHASKLHGMTMKQVLDSTQALYDKHELVTYPRSDTGYLPLSQHADSPGVIATIAANIPSLKDASEDCDPSLISRAFNDKKVTAHHAIIPTQKKSYSALAALSDSERIIYEMVCSRYLMQFMPDAEYSHREATIKSEHGERFKAKSKVCTATGWQALQGSSKDDDEENDQSAIIPKMEEGDEVRIAEITATDKTTQPPKHYTDATILDAMTNIHLHVEDKEVAKHLKEGEGIGTEATRADTLEKMISHELLTRDAKKIKSTEGGRFHCQMMPSDLTTPDMAGLFEYSTRQVEAGNMAESDFLSFIGNFISHQIDSSSEWIERARKYGIESNGPACRHCSSGLKKGKSREKKTKLWICKTCDSIYMDESGSPGFCIKGELSASDKEAKEARYQERLKDAPPCPNCKEPILREKSKRKNFYWNCRSCNSLYSDYAGEIGPAFKINGEDQTAVADGPECSHCDQPMHRRMTKKRRAMLVCDNCDSMAWSDDGSLGTYFKIKGEMQKVGAVEKSSD